MSAPLVESVWCEVCGVQPVIYDKLKANGMNDHDATDIICGKCHLVIATLHHPHEPGQVHTNLEVVGES